MLAPNVYRIPTILGSSKEGGIRSAPAFTITGRHKAPVQPTISVPGPGSYDAKLELLQRKSPMYSMATRFRLPNDSHMKPGPGAHCPEKVRITS